MKRFLYSLLLIFLSASFMYAQKSGDEDDGGDYYEPSYDYKMNGSGDQYIKIALMGVFPQNFSDKLSAGGAAEIGYHRFLTELFALGFDVQFGYNPTIGSNMFTYVPMTFTGTFQPYFGKFEFPLTLGVGAALESYLNRNYFPGLILKAQAGAFYRVMENWSFGIESEYIYMPQWYVEHPEWNDYGLFLTVGLIARYHF